MFLSKALQLFLLFAMVACGQLENEPRSVSKKGTSFGSSDATVSHEPFLVRGWKSYPIIFELSEEFSLEESQNIQLAAEIWNEAVGKRIIEVDLSSQLNLVRDYNEVKDDAVNMIYKENNWCATAKKEEVLGTTLFSFETHEGIKKIKSSDIIVNFEHYAFNTNEERGLPQVDLTTLLIHEFGHALGLSHIFDEELSAMKPMIGTGREAVKRSVSRNDVDRVKFLLGMVGSYPKMTAPEINRGINEQLFHSCK